MSATLLPPWEKSVLVTYVVDTGATYTEKIKKNVDCLNPEGFTPTKSGYTFTGWREDTSASGDVLTEKTAEKGLILYAVFEKFVTLTYYATSSTKATATGTQYYNNGNVTNPTFTVSNPTLSGWTFEGWVTSTSATASVAYSTISGTAFSEDATLYGKFSCTITVTYYATSSSKSTKTGTRYFNAYGNYSNPTISISNPSLSGWTFLGWVTSTSATASVAYSSLSSGTTFSSDITLYGKFSCTVTITYYATSSSKSTATGTRYFNAYGNYSNPTFTISNPSLSGWTFLGWCTSTSATASVAYSSISSTTFSSDTTLYGKFSCTITITYYATSSTKSTTTGTRYFNAYGNYSNPTFTISNPSLSGWTFLGWCTSTSATASVAYSSISSTSFTANTTLYGKFSCTITVTYYSTSSSSSTKTGTRYFNAYGNYSNPTITISDPSLSGWTFLGWVTSTSATASVAYSSLSSGTTFSANTTLYGKFSCTITITYYSTSSSSSTKTGTRYFNAYGNYSNPTITISDPSLSGWTFLGWVTSTSATASVSYSSLSSGTTFSSNTTLYGKFSCTITLSYNGNSSTSGSTSSQTGTRYFNAYGNYSNPSFTLSSNGFTRTNYTWYAWASGSTSGTQYAAGASVTLTSSTTFYACWVVTATNFSYTGGMQSYTTTCAGTYKFEVWGAQGGSSTYSSSGGHAGSGGKGGYAYGSISLSKGTTVYICVGRQPSSKSGGYNGGGTAHDGDSDKYGAGGGGATSITKTNAVLASCSSSNVYIVGGGGGGGGSGSTSTSSSWQNADGGVGGGSSGGYANPSSSSYTASNSNCGSPGTQSSGGYYGSPGFGYGGSSSGLSGWDGCGGGGGGYYGGGCGVNYNGPTGGGGGSGYTGGMSSSTGMTSGSRSGDGYATITITAVS